MKALNKAIKLTKDAKGDLSWITKKGHHLGINGEGEIVAGGIPNSGIGKGTKLQSKKATKSGSHSEELKKKLSKVKPNSDYEETLENLLDGVEKDYSSGKIKEEEYNKLKNMISDKFEECEENFKFDPGKKDIPKNKSKTKGLTSEGYFNWAGKLDKATKEEAAELGKQIEEAYKNDELNSLELAQLRGLYKSYSKKSRKDQDLEFFKKYPNHPSKNNPFLKKENKDELSGGTQMANYRYDPMMAMNIPVRVTRAQDASRGHEIVRRTENYLSSIGKNNSTGKYDKIVSGVKSLLEQGFLKDDDLEKAVRQETNRLLKKYSLDAEPTELMNEGKCPEGMTCDATDALTWNVAITIDYEDPDGVKGRKSVYGPISNVFTQAQKLVDTLEGHDCTIMAAKFGR